MTDLQGHERKYLRRLAHHLKPVVYIGKGGVTETVVRSADEALEAHELIKAKFVDCKDRKRELTDELAEGANAICAGLIGNVAILYRQHPDEEKRKIDLSEASR